ncbi:GlcG/HbpS family heme-binding protein [Frateuria aurantia]
MASFSGHAAQPGDLTYANAVKAIAAAEQTAISLNAKVCIAVVDSNGVLEAFKRMDGSAPGCVASAINKARAAAIYRTPTYNFMARVNHGEPALVTLPGMVPLGGGVPAQDNAGAWVGAVGDAGSANPNEVKIATVGAAALGQH